MSSIIENISSTHRYHRQPTGLTCYGPDWHIKRKSGMEYRTFGQPATTIGPLLGLKILPLPWFPVAMISMDLAPEIVNYVQYFDWCSNIFATWTAIDIDNYLLKFSKFFFRFLRFKTNNCNYLDNL